MMRNSVNVTDRLNLGGRKTGGLPVRGRRRLGGMLLLALVGSAVGSAGVAKWQQAQAHRGRVYTASGLGGWVAPHEEKPLTVSEANDPLRSLRADYSAGRWADVDSKAESLMARQGFGSEVNERKQAGQAELLAAYASAWRKDYAGAGRKFLAVQRLAGELPDHGARKAALGDAPQPTLEEEASFQQAVCRGAAGDTRGAEAEYDDFMRQYPQSVLVHAAIKRVTRLHGGDIPQDAEELWTDAMKQQGAKQAREKREASLCGPECLAELLRRSGKQADIHGLAGEMRTDGNGTSLQELANVAQAHGFRAQGVELTQRGLAQQKLPLIALLRPGHYVLVERVTAENVAVWNPDANGVGRAGVKTYPVAEWQAAWTGMGLAVKQSTLKLAANERE